MRELLAPHWILGSLLAVGGASLYRWGSRTLPHVPSATVPLLGLGLLTVGLFLVMRGVSQKAAQRPPLSEEESLRHIPGLRRRTKD